MQQGFRAQRDKTPFDKLAQAFARTRLGGWLFVNVFPVIDRRLIPLTGGRLAVAVGQPMLLLHTRGARSGQPRSTPLLYTRHGRGYVVVASKAGADHHPAWYHNLRAHPDAVTIEVGGRHIPVRPREAEGAERAELWRLVNDNYNGYQVYQQRAGQRIIPVVLLEPALRQQARRCSPLQVHEHSHTNQGQPVATDGWTVFAHTLRAAAISGRDVLG